MDFELTVSMMCANYGNLDKLRKGDTVYIHPEAEYHPSTTLQKIINAGMTPGIAINPGTSIETVMEMLVIVKKVLVMSVNPGNAGQIVAAHEWRGLIEECLKKTAGSAGDQLEPSDSGKRAEELF